MNIIYYAILALLVACLLFVLGRVVRVVADNRIYANFKTVQQNYYMLPSPRSYTKPKSFLRMKNNGSHPCDLNRTIQVYDYGKDSHYFLEKQGEIL